MGLLVSSPALAQRYLVHTYTELDGLPSTAVRSVAQDGDRRIWIATRAGLAAYDGATWVARTGSDWRQSSLGLLRVDARGVLWAANEFLPIRVRSWETSAWREWPGPPEAPSQGRVVAFAVQAHPEGTRLLVATRQGGLYLWEASGWTTLALAGARRVFAVEATPAGFHVGTDAGLFVLDVRASEEGLQPVPAAGHGDILGIEADGPSRLWLVGCGWIGRLEGETLTRDLSGEDLHYDPEYREFRLQADGAGGLYLGNLERVSYFHPDIGLEPMGPRSGLVAHGVTEFHLDREGNLWIASLRGLSKVVSRRIASYRSEHGLFADEVSAVLERRSGAIVLGHPGGLTFLDPAGASGAPHRRPRALRLGDEAGCRVLDLAEDAAGRLWVAAAHRGLAAVDSRGRIAWHMGESDTQVTSVHVDAGGHLWVLRQDALHRRRGEAFEAIALPRQPGQRLHLRRILEGASGRLYVASHLGIYVVDGDRVAFHGRRVGGPERDAYAVHETPSGEIWVGTRGGLQTCRGDTLARVLAPGPQIDRPVYAICEDAQGRIDFGTDNGVMRWDGRRFDRLTARDGLAGNETNRAALTVDRHGWLWIGTDGGVSIYRAAFDRPRPSPPVVEILSLVSGGRSHALESGLDLAPENDDWFFRFSAPTFVDEKRLQFRYRLEGYDAGWVGPHQLPEREIRYSNLSPGTYRLHLQVTDGEERESPVAVSPPIVLQPPYWARWWFRAAAGLAAAGGVVALVWYRARQRYAARLARSRRRMQALFDHALDAFGLVNDALRIEDANAAFCTLVGRSRADVVGTELPLLLPEAERPGFAIWWQRFRTSGRSEGERALPRPDGSQVEIEFRAVADVEPGVHLLSLRDVTDRKHIEEALRRSERLASLGTLAAGIAHEINNPVGGILMAAQYALGSLERGDTPAVVEALHDVESDSKRCGRIVDGVLQLARNAASPKSACSLHDIVRAALAATRQYAAEKRARVIADLPEPSPVVEANALELERALVNLLRNAIESEAEGVCVTVRVQARDDRVEVGIEDTGSGFSDAVRDRLTDPFFTTRRAAGGTGLGLSLAQAIVEDHAGTLAFSGAPGRGAIFTIELPALGRPAHQEVP